MGRRHVAALEKLDADLSSLQNKLRRDPASYTPEFLAQWTAYDALKEALLSTLALSTGTTLHKQGQQLCDFMHFISHVIDNFPDHTTQYVRDVQHFALHQDIDTKLRVEAITSLALLRRKRVIDADTLFTTLFRILTCSSGKILRNLYVETLTPSVRKGSQWTNTRKGHTGI